MLLLACCSSVLQGMGNTSLCVSTTGPFCRAYATPLCVHITLNLQGISSPCWWLFPPTGCLLPLLSLPPSCSHPQEVHHHAASAGLCPPALLHITQLATPPSFWAHCSSSSSRSHPQDVRRRAASVLAAPGAAVHEFCYITETLQRLLGQGPEGAKAAAGGAAGGQAGPRAVDWFVPSTHLPAAQVVDATGSVSAAEIHRSMSPVGRTMQDDAGAWPMGNRATRAQHPVSVCTGVGASNSMQD
eukprot:1161252-Pelagomonas_calceolata.AAC.2